MENISLEDILNIGFNGGALVLLFVVWRRLNEVTDKLIDIQTKIIDVQALTAQAFASRTEKSPDATD